MKVTFVLISALLVIACKTRNFSSTGSLETVENGQRVTASFSGSDGVPDPIQCKPGEFPTYFRFSSSRIGDTPPSTDVLLKGTFQFDAFSLVRLGFCVESDGRPRLAEIFFGQYPEGMVLPRNWRVSIETLPASDAFLKLLADGDVSGIDVQLVDAANPATMLLLKGWKTSSGNILTLSPSAGTGNERLVVPSRSAFDAVYFGEIKEGDPFAKNPNTRSISQFLQGSDFSLRLEYDVVGTHQSFSLSYIFKNLELIDAKATPQQQLLSGTALEKAVQVTLSHHSFTDGFTFTVGSGEYSLLPAGSQKWTLKATVPGVADRTKELSCELIYSCGEISTPEQPQ